MLLELILVAIVAAIIGAIYALIKGGDFQEKFKEGFMPPFAILVAIDIIMMIVQCS